ncbi:BMP family ABC transporter substrate-binding protein [Tuanshanicoccus lijuaniae]|uniref:BMP family lipoprotein n=1 Tax=Aerococcaceae bacterium zg-1292 TaxID=2774330 RepID=UPI0019389745|nr:BMP family ABC transporter substrate-binding protein [Aerococcaceae bacterium zg-1292]QQA36615.1 BMP family ABC transporter substrate-binding protein [Aerococcaceae bacterium zg-1292]
MKSVLRIFIVFLVVSSAFCNISNNSLVQAKDYKVAMITSEGGLGDRSFNDSGNAGLERAKKELGIDFKVVEPSDVSEGETYLRQLADAGMDLIITMDLGHKDVLESIASEYPDTQFVIVNTIAEGDNISSIMFKEQEASFLVGALAALITTDKNVENTNSESKISFIGGIDSPGINIFLTGYTSGAHYINDKIEVLSSYSNSFADPAKGKEIALSQIAEGSDIVFQVAGATGEGIIQAAKEKSVFAIGVDSNQDDIAPGYVLTSVLKRVDNALYSLIESGVSGKEYQKVYELGLKEEGVQLTEMEHTKDMIPKEYLNKIEEIKEKIINGEIEVEDTRK